jgi:predicted nucleic acid-binding protein
LLLPGVRTAQAEAVFRKDAQWAAPVLWRSEFRSVLALCLWKGNLTLADALRLYADAETMFRGAEHTVEGSSVLELASASRCSAYDCEFVAVARQLGVPLVTADAKVLAAFPAYAVSPEAFCRP